MPALHCRCHQILWQFQRNNVQFYGETLERQLPEIQIVVGETVTFVWAEGQSQSQGHRAQPPPCRLVPPWALAVIWKAPRFLSPGSPPHFPRFSRLPSKRTGEQVKRYLRKKAWNTCSKFCRELARMPRRAPMHAKEGTGPNREFRVVTEAARPSICACCGRG